MFCMTSPFQATSIENTPNTKANAPVSFTQRGAFQAAKNISARTAVSIAINTGPPAINNLNMTHSGRDFPYTFSAFRYSSREA